MVVSGPVVSGCRKDKGSPYDTNLPSVDPQNLHLPLESWGFRIPTLSVDVSMFFGNKPTEDILFPGFGFKSRPKWHQEEFQSESNGNLIPNTPNLTRKLLIMILPSLKLTAILLPKGKDRLLGGGFKYFLFSPLVGEMIQLDIIWLIFFRWVVHPRTSLAIIHFQV